jgi:hypothetical protein
MPRQHSVWGRLATGLGLATGLVLACAGPLSAAEPVKHVAIHVEPFYVAAPARDVAPKVGVGGAYSALLASTNPENILAVADMIRSKPALTTPMTMMVLAIRFYDMGRRDDAVFWFYAAKDRYMTLREVIVPDAPQLAQSADAMNSFNALLGPIINGYAFCDVARQQAQRVKALAWVEANPYQAVFLDQLAARGADRKALLAAAVAKARENAEKERAHLADPANVQALKAGRAKNDMDSKYCWAD